MKADLHEAGRKQIAPGQAPEHRTFEASGNSAVKNVAVPANSEAGPSSLTS
jgi:hypothetical protein